MKAGIAVHVRAAIAEADVIVFVTDATTGPNDADRAAIKLLRRSGKPVFYAANKADSPRADAEAFELYRLGVDKVYPVSALHGRGIGDLEAAVVEALPAQEPAVPSRRGGAARIALIGRPNAGKSSLLNRILGEDRVLVDSRPGTTRDAIDALVERDGKRYVFIDTAGIREKSKVDQGGQRGRVDERALEHPRHRARARGRDAVRRRGRRRRAGREDPRPGRGARARRWSWRSTRAICSTRTAFAKAEENAREKLSFAAVRPHRADRAPRRGAASASCSRRSTSVRDALLPARGDGRAQSLLRDASLETEPPPTMGGRAPRLYYVTQAEVAPPTFVAMTNAPDCDPLLVPTLRRQPAAQALRLRGRPRPRALQGRRRRRAERATASRDRDA